jgi:hypothetical protein
MGLRDADLLHQLIARSQEGWEEAALHAASVLGLNAKGAVHAILTF